MCVDHSSINRRAIRFLPLLEKVLRKHKRPVGGSRRMGETSIKVQGAWKRLCRAVDKSGANKAAMEEINDRGERPIIVRHVKCLNSIVAQEQEQEQEQRAIKRVARPMLNFKSFRAARNAPAGIEPMHMIRKGQPLQQGCSELSSADQFYALAGQIRPA